MATDSASAPTRWIPVLVLVIALCSFFLPALQVTTKSLVTASETTTVTSVEMVQGAVSGYNSAGNYSKFLKSEYVSGVVKDIVTSKTIAPAVIMIIIYYVGLTGAVLMTVFAIIVAAAKRRGLWPYTLAAIFFLAQLLSMTALCNYIQSNITQYLGGLSSLASVSLASGMGLMVGLGLAVIAWVARIVTRGK